MFPERKGGGGNELDVVQRKYRQRMNTVWKVRQLGDAEVILRVFSSVHSALVREAPYSSA